MISSGAGESWLKAVIERTGAGGEPEIVLIKPTELRPSRLGVFASSFNPITCAHVELMRRAAEIFSLDEVLALAGKVNADKTDYECPLEERLAMLIMSFAEDPVVSVGISSHPYFVDMVGALDQIYSTSAEVFFILGFDTFERVLDFQAKYFARYHRRFDSSREAVDFLFKRSWLIVAGRGGATRSDFQALVDRAGCAPGEKIFYLDFPADLGEQSSTEVRTRLKNDRSISGLVPAVVERYIAERAIYKTGYVM